MAAIDEAAYWRTNGAWRGTNPVFSEDGHTHPGGSEAFAVGGVYINLTGVNPATELGYGTWAAFGAGRLLIGLDAADPDFDTVRETGGAKTHTHGDQLGHDAHAVTQPANHVFTQPGGHSNHIVTQPNDHADVLNHVHVQMRLPTATGGSTGFTVDTSMSGTPGTTSVDTANPKVGGVAAQVHAGAAVDAHSAHAGGAVDAHSGAAVGAHAAHGSHGATDHKPPYVVVYMWERTA